VLDAPEVALKVDGALFDQLEGEVYNLVCESTV
jgi:hypothetical protein